MLSKTALDKLFLHQINAAITLRLKMSIGGRAAEICFGITFWRSLETRLNSVAKPTEFVPKPFLACVTFFVTLESSKHKLKFLKQ